MEDNGDTVSDSNADRRAEAAASGMNDADSIQALLQQEAPFFSPHVLMARCLGQPGLEYKSHPFNKRVKQWKPSWETLMKEYKLRFHAIVPVVEEGHGNDHSPQELPTKKRPTNYEIETWLRENPITDQQEIDTLQTQYDHHKAQLEAELLHPGSVARQQETSRSSLVVGGEQGEGGGIPHNGGATGMAQPPRQEAAGAGHGSIALLSPQLLLARALGLMGCDFQQEPFNGKRLYKPTKVHLFDECKRRISNLETNHRRNRWQYPSTQWSAKALADWLRNNGPNGSSQEVQDLMNQVVILKKSIALQGAAQVVTVSDPVVPPPQSSFKKQDSNSREASNDQPKQEEATEEKEGSDNAAQESFMAVVKLLSNENDNSDETNRESSQGEEQDGDANNDEPQQEEEEKEKEEGSDKTAQEPLMEVAVLPANEKDNRYETNRESHQGEEQDGDANNDEPQEEDEAEKKEEGSNNTAPEPSMDVAVLPRNQKDNGYETNRKSHQGENAGSFRLPSGNVFSNT